MSACPNCATPLPDAAKFCGQCGFVVRPPDARPSNAPGYRPAAMTIVGVPGPLAQAPGGTTSSPPGAPAPQAAAPATGFANSAPPGPLALPAPQRTVAMAAFVPPTAPGDGPPRQTDPLAPQPDLDPLRGRGSMQHTMLGMKAPVIAPVSASAPPPADAMRAQLSANRTMLGVATPGIAPLHASEPPAYRSAAATMLGVAAPGIAPLNAGYSAPPPMYSMPPDIVPRGLFADRALDADRAPMYSMPPDIVPAPPPLVDESLPPPPVVAPRSGLPIALVAGVAGALLLAGAAIVAVTFRVPPPMSGASKVGAGGKEQLHLVCEGCADGTTVRLGDARSVFTGHQADIDVPSPLRVGDNAFALTIDRPSLGRDEQVKLTVPVAYRIQPDLSKLVDVAPSIQVKVEATVGSTVELGGKSVALDASGNGVETLNVSDEVSGQGEARTFEKRLGYVVTGAKGEKSAGEVVAKVGVPKLTIDAPGPRATTQDATVNVSGRTSKGALVTVNGARAPVSDDGIFAVKAPVPAGDAPILVVRAQSAPGGAEAAPRIVTIPVKRVTSLEAEAASLEKNAGPGWDALTRDLSGAKGKDIIVEGSVLESRAQNHCSILLVDDRRGCKKGNCVIRVLYGGGQAVAGGDVIRAYGSVRGAFASKEGTEVPEMTADFILKGKSK